MKTKLLLLFLLGIVIITSCHKDKNNDTIKQATSVQLTKSTLSLVVGGREKLLLIVDPIDATVNDAKWSSSNPSVAIVNEKGTVTALSTGQTTISMSTGNKTSQQCTLNVIAFPIVDLKLPDVEYPIAKDAIVMIQGSDFKTGDKIWLRKNTSSGIGLKSVQADDIFLAQINEQAAKFISFYCSVTPGWYTVVLEENSVQYDMGNIDIETPTISEYAYDNNKIIWEDTQWRRFQLRGKVKDLVVKTVSLQNYNSSHPYEWKYESKYLFNKNGFIESRQSYDDSILMDSYVYNYNSKNQIIKQTCVQTNCTPLQTETIEFTYGDHNLYYPVSLWTDSFGRVGTQEGGTFWVKGLSQIDYKCTYTKDGSSDITSTKFTIGSNYINAVSTQNISYDKQVYIDNYTYNYMNNSGFPIKSIDKYNYYYGPTSGRSTGENQTNLEFSSNGIPIRYSRTSDNVTLSTYIQNSPFYLTSGYSTYYASNSNCEYDKNWNLAKRIEKGSSTLYCYYLSYDDQGNWTQCKCIENSDDGTWGYIYTVTRDFTYW